MKNLIFIYLFIFTSLNSYGQDKIKILKSNSSTFIETYYYFDYKNEFNLINAIRIGPTSFNTLLSGVKTAIKWAELNLTHRKQFSKEVCRFKAMDKSDFDSLGYADHLNKEFVLIFYGNDDGTFKLVLEENRFMSNGFLTIDNYEALQSFKKLLEGKSVNNDIDDIFKR